MVQINFSITSTGKIENTNLFRPLSLDAYKPLGEAISELTKKFKLKGDQEYSFLHLNTTEDGKLIVGGTVTASPSSRCVFGLATELARHCDAWLMHPIGKLHAQLSPFQQGMPDPAYVQCQPLSLHFEVQVDLFQPYQWGHFEFVAIYEDCVRRKSNKNIQERNSKDLQSEKKVNWSS